MCFISSSIAVVQSSMSPQKILDFRRNEIPTKYRGRWYSPMTYDAATITRSSFLGLGKVTDVRRAKDNRKLATFAVRGFDGKCAHCVQLRLLHPNVIEYERTTWNSLQTAECQCGERSAERGRAAVRSLLYRHETGRSVNDCPAFVTEVGGDDGGGRVEFEVTFHEFVGGQYVGPCGAGGGHRAASCANVTDMGQSHLWIGLNRCADFDQVVWPHGIHVG